MAGVYKVAAQDFGHPERFTSVPKVMRISVFMKAVVFYIVPVRAFATFNKAEFNQVQEC